MPDEPEPEPPPGLSPDQCKLVTIHQQHVRLQGKETTPHARDSQTRVPFWTPLCQETSRTWWSPTKTDCVETPLNSWNGAVARTGRLAWLKTHLITPKISSMTSMAPTSSPVESMECDTPATDSPSTSTTTSNKTKKRKKEGRWSKKKKGPARPNDPEDDNEDLPPQNHRRMTKVEVKLTKKQRKLVQRWKNVHKFIYNRCVAYFNSTIQRFGRATALQRMHAKNEQFDDYTSYTRKQKEQERNGNTQATTETGEGENVPSPAEYTLKSVSLQNFYQKMNRQLRTTKHYNKLMEGVPERIRCGAVSQFVDALASAFTNQRNGRIRKFTMKLLSRKSNVVLSLERADYSPRKGRMPPRRGYNQTRHKKQFFRSKGFGPFRPVDPTLKVPSVKNDCKLLWKRSTRQWFLLVPFVKRISAVKSENVQRGVCSLDPGVRTFMTFYSPDVLGGVAGELGKDSMEQRIIPYLNSIHKMSKVFDRRRTFYTKGGKVVKCRLRLKIARKLAQKYDKVSSLIKDAHCRIARWLCDHFHTIILPEFKTHAMVRRKGRRRRLRRKTVRALQNWKHYQFRQRLIHTAETTMNTHVILCSEEYTSKTCSQCGYLYRGLGSKKTFSCPSCHSIMDRDVNAAKNILLKCVRGRGALPPP